MFCDLWFFFNLSNNRCKQNPLSSRSSLPLDMSDAQTYFETRDMLLYLTAPIAIIGGLNWLYTGAANLLDPTGGACNDLINRFGILPPLLVNIIYLIVGLAAIGLAAFLYIYSYGAPDILDASFFPSTLITAARSPTNANAATRVRVTPFAKVAYWAARPALEEGGVHESANDAYGTFENSGIAIADANGEAVLRFRVPGAYKVQGKVLEPHVHYRVARAALEDASGNDIDPKRVETHTWSAIRTLYTFQAFAQEPTVREQ